MRDAVTIKSFPNGLKLILDPSIPFENLYVAYAQKLIDSERFLGDAKLVITFKEEIFPNLKKELLSKPFLSIPA